MIYYALTQTASAATGHAAQIGPDSLIPVGVAAGLAFALLVAVWKAATAFSRLTSQIEGMRKLLAYHMGRELSRQTFETWAARLDAANEGITVPEIPRELQ